MGKCKNYTLDCKQEEMGCEGCAYCKETAKTDITYCTNEKCETKEECDRHEEYQGGNYE